MHMKKLTINKAGNAVKIFMLTFLLSFAACNSNNNANQPVENEPTVGDSIADETKKADSVSSASVVAKDSIESVADSVSEQKEPEPEVKEQPKQKPEAKKVEKKKSSKTDDVTAPAPKKEREEDEGVLVW